MLPLRRTSCHQIAHNRRLLKCLFSRHAHYQNAATIYHDETHIRPVDFTTLGFLGGDGLRGEQKKKDVTKSPHELLRQLGPSKPDSGKRSSNEYIIEDNFHGRYMTPAARVGSVYYKTMEEMRHIEAQALFIGREIARRSKDTYILRRAFRRLFEYCSTVRDIIHVLAIAFQKPSSTEVLQHLSHPIVRALFRARAYATDRRIYTVYYALILRLEKAGLQVDHTYYNHCAKFAARSRDPIAMQRALWLFRSRNLEMNFRTFRAIVAKFSIGANGYGELRNGRWRRRDLLPVVLGFDGTWSGNPSGEVEDHHLGSFLKRDQWQYLAAWVQILAHCRAIDELWAEWLLWKDSALRQKEYKTLDGKRKAMRERRDEFFIIHMLIAGNIKTAWMVLNESKLDVWQLNVEVRTKLFDDIEHIHFTMEAFGDRESFKKALMEKYVHDLELIEAKLGITWKSDGRGGGWHVVNDDLEERLEHLSSANFGHVYGYFIEEEPEQKCRT